MLKFKPIVCALLLCLCFVVPAEAKTLRFAQLSDIHFSLSGVTEYNSRDLSKTVETLDKAIDEINAKDVDFVISLGDNIDKSREEDLAVFLRKMQKVKKPYYLDIGNHDSYKISGISKQTYIAYVQKYNKYQKFNSFNYTFSPTQDILAVVVDGVFPLVPSTHGVIQEKTLKWVDEVLSKHKDKKVIIFQHFPVIEPYENKSHMLVYKEQYMEMLAKHKNVIAICSGHYHEAKVTKDERGVYHISAPSLGTSQEYQIVEINYDPNMFSSADNFKINVEKFAVKQEEKTPVEEGKTPVETEKTPVK